MEEKFFQGQTLARVIDAIIKNRVIINVLTIITNGTLYTKEIEELLRIINNYISQCNRFTFAMFSGIRIELSNDKYHRAELDRIKDENIALYYKYVGNIRRLISSEYFAGIRGLGNLINAGRATELDEEKSAPTCTPIFYANVNTPIGNCLIVNDLGIDIKGSVCNTCGEMPPKPEAVYGNIINEQLRTILSRVGIEFKSEEDLLAKYKEYLASLNDNPVR